MLNKEEKYYIIKISSLKRISLEEKLRISLDFSKEICLQKGMDKRWKRVSAKVISKQE